MMGVTPATLPLVMSVLVHLRREDRTELEATWPSWVTREAWADALTRAPGVHLVAGDKAVGPIVVFGVLRLWPGVGSAYAAATDHWFRIARPLTRYVRDCLAPQMRQEFHRIECRSLASHIRAHRWIEFLGGRREAVLEGYGQHGEDFVQFAWTRRAGGTA